ncbi:sensor histidine kinase [Deinococcus sonorensis]|uniref:histidine kinase n=2 Tax=Deinococcus sonorensis TaxID=309891 RepID=A0AAU7U7M9_9DEIO
MRSPLHTRSATPPRLPDPQRRRAAYLLTLGLSVLALLVRFALNPLLDGSSPFLFSLLAVTAAAFLAGFRAGVCAVLISAVGVNFLVTQPAFQFNIHLPPHEVRSLLVFVLVGVAVSWLGSHRLSALRRAEHARLALAEREAQFRALSDNLPGTMLYQAERQPGGQTRFVYVSANVERLNGVTAEQVYADSTLLFQRILPDHLSSVLAAEEHAVRTKTAFAVEVPFRQPNGEVRWMHLSSQARVLPDGREVWDGVQHDVTDRHAAQEELRNVNVQLELRVQERTRQLERSNQQLAQFTHIASHDLKAPVRTVISSLQLLERRSGALLDERARTYLRMTLQAADRMHQLVDDLLTYGMVGQERSRVRVEAQQVLEDVLHDLSSSLQAQGASVHAAPLPAVMANATQLRQVFSNLVGNALKFTVPGQPPDLAIQATQEGAAVHFTVSDNGIGIAPEDHERVFEVLQRLHTRERYEGTGMGLAIVRKIVEEHHGRLWVQSELGQGSTFHFTLPAAAPTE